MNSFIHLFFIVVPVILTTTTIVVESSFLFNTKELSRHLIPLSDHVGSRPVHFKPAEIRGDKFQRPVGKSPLRVRREDLSTSPVRTAMAKYSGSTASTDSTVPCTSVEQVHMTLGNNIDSVIVSFVSTNPSVPSTIYFGTNQAAVAGSKLNNPGSGVQTATGKFITYSELMFISPALYKPSLGAAEQSANYIASLENTSTWAYDKTTGEHWDNWKVVNGDRVVTGLGAYNNPYMVYDSPYIHTVTLTGLTPGQVYYYRPAASCTGTSYRVTIPLPGTAAQYPFTLGLTCDLGQTLVSEVSLEAVIKMEPDVVVMAGDLSYADGYMPLWDSFGVLIEKLTANVPFLTTGMPQAYLIQFIYQNRV